MKLANSGAFLMNSIRLSCAAERSAAAVERLSPDALRWLVNGERLLRNGRTLSVG